MKNFGEINGVLRAELVTLILVVGTVSAIIFHYSKFAFVGNHAPTPDSFLHYPINIFCDFYSLFDGYVRLKFRVVMNYLPGLYIPLEGLARLSGNNPYLALEITVATYFSLLIPYIYFSLRSIRAVPRILASFALIACSYPVLFTIHTGNFEMLCFLLVAYAIYFRIKKFYFLAGALIGIAAAIKLYPAIFLFSIATTTNRIKLFLGSIFAFIGTIIIAFGINGSILDHFLTWLSVAEKGFDNYTKMMVIGTNGIYFGHSLMNAFRIVNGAEVSIVWLLPYFSVFSIFFFCVTFIGMHKAKYIYMRILLPACAICLFAPTSQDYKLLYLTIPLLILLCSNRKLREETVLSVIIAAIFIPKTYYTFNTFITSNTLLNATLLSAAFLYASYLAVFDNRFKRRAHP